MKYIYIVLIVIVIGYFWFFHNHQSVTPHKINYSMSITPTATVTLPLNHTVSYGNKSYAYEMIVANPKNVSLVPNYSIKQEFMAIMKTASCKSAINGGFYDTDFHPLGYLVVDDDVQSDAITSALLNGYFSIDPAGAAQISQTKPSSPVIALQSGPMLRIGGHPVDLSINNDTYARRMILGITSDQTLIFMTIFTQDAVFNGPLLADLPGIIGAIATKESVSILDAINLDGGTASAFSSPNRTLSEIAPVGSVLCVH